MADSNSLLGFVRAAWTIFIEVAFFWQLVRPTRKGLNCHLLQLKVLLESVCLVDEQGRQSEVD